jgi:hypothetical protein
LTFAARGALLSSYWHGAWKQGSLSVARQESVGRIKKELRRKEKRVLLEAGKAAPAKLFGLTKLQNQ